MISLPAVTPSGVAVFVPLTERLFGNRTVSPPAAAAAAAASAPLAGRGMQQAGLGHHAGSRMTVSRDIAQLLGWSGSAAGPPPGTRGGAADPPFDLPNARMPHWRRGRAAKAVPATPATPPTPATPATPTTPADTASADTARYQAMPVDALLGDIAHCAATFGPGDCTYLGRNGTTAYHERLKSMAAALQVLPERRCDLTQLLNAYFAVRRSFHRMRHLVRQIHIGHPDLAPLLPAWAADMAGAASRRALALPVQPECRDLDNPHRYGPAFPEFSRPIAFHVVALRQRRAEAEIVRAGLEIDRLFQEIYAPGNRLVVGASVQEYVPRDEYFNWLLRGVIVIDCDVQTLPRILHAIPGAQLNAGGARAATYPADSGILRVVWRRPSGAETTLLVHAGTGAGQRYSLDGGRSWQPTGVPATPALEARRIAGWRQFLAHRRQDATEPYWTLVHRGPFRIRPLAS